MHGRLPRSSRRVMLQHRGVKPWALDARVGMPCAPRRPCTMRARFSSPFELCAACLHVTAAPGLASSPACNKGRGRQI